MKNTAARLSLAAALLLSAAVLSADNLPASSKAQYKDAGSYLDICKSPEKLTKKDDIKLKFKIVFKNKADKLPPKYEDAFSKNLEMVVPDVEVPEGYVKIPIAYSSAKSKLTDDIGSLELGRPAIIYASLRYKIFKDKDPKKKDADLEKLFILIIDDIESPDVAVKEAIDGAKDADFAPSKARRVDLQYEKFLDKKVSFSLRYKDVDNKLPPDILKLTDLSNERNFVIIPSETFRTPIIVARDNEKCVEPLIDANPGDLMTLSGVLRKAEDPSSQKKLPVYFFFVYKLQVEAAPAPAPQGQPSPAAQPGASLPDWKSIIQQQGQQGAPAQEQPSQPQAAPAVAPQQ